MQIAVHALVFDKGRVLALKPDGAGLYRLPKALLRDGETLVEAAKRSLKKEAGIEATGLQFVGIYDALDRNPLGREVAAVLLAQSWRETAEKGEGAGVCWVADFKGAPWIFDHVQILAEQEIFAPLSHRQAPLELVKADA
jgi:ADP-ribose pyrophosphatase YjhB (NUDIX family)